MPLAVCLAVHTKILTMAEGNIYILDITLPMFHKNENILNIKEAVVVIKTMQVSQLFLP